MKKNSNIWTAEYGTMPNITGNWRWTCLVAVKRGPLGHTERTPIGIYVHGYARIVLDVVAAVDAIVAAVRSLVQQTQHTIDGIKVIALALVVAAFALRDVMDVVSKSEAT